jgi:triphosphoribosyl-dephospho-CoA synthetase
VKQSSMMVPTAVSPRYSLPITPKVTRSLASRSKGEAYSLASSFRRAQRTVIDVQNAPDKKDRKAASPMSRSEILPRARLSAIAETTPDMCDVYW